MANLNRLRASALPSGSKVKSAELKSMEIGAFLTGCLELVNLNVVSAKAASGMTLVLRIYWLRKTSFSLTGSLSDHYN